MKSISFSIDNAGYSYKTESSSPSSWQYGKRRILAAQQGATPQYIYCSILEFTFPSIVSSKLNTLKLVLDYEDWAMDATSAILSSEYSKPLEIFKLTSQEAAKAMPGYITHVQRAETIEENETITWTFDLSEVESNLESKKLYIYIKKELGKNEKPGEYVSMLNPVYYNQTENLILNYEDSGYYLLPENFTVQGLDNIQKKIELYQKGSDENPDTLIQDFSNVSWSYKLYDENDTELTISEDNPPIIYTEDGMFTFIYPFTPGHARIVAQVGGSISVPSNAIFPSKWGGLKSWLVGYAIKMMGSFIPSSAIIAYQYNNDIILPVFDFQLMQKYKNLCITEDPVLQGVYYLYVTENELEYNVENGLTLIKGQASVYKLDKKINIWKADGEKENFYIEPIWTYRDIKDSSGNIKIKSYKPAPIYIKEE